MRTRCARGLRGGLWRFVQVSAATVLTSLQPLLLGVLLLVVIPRGLYGVIAARIDYRVHERIISASQCPRAGNPRAADVGAGLDV
ncbi:hypothetical protein BGK72_34565 [Streptomyces agglomeratus]|nr:hypothetical protein BGK72_34565 [Streptomyces agglomeratus]